MGIYANDVQKLYIAYFNRPADPVGLAYWEEQITKAGGNTSAVANAFSASAEYKALYDGKSSAQIVDAIYQNLFGRSAEPSGLTYWALRLDNGTFNVGNIALSIMVGAQNDDKKVVDNKVVVATDFTTAIDTSAEILAYSGTTAAESARTFLKTVGSTDSSVTTAKAAVASTITSIANTTAANGTTFTLTVGADTFTGTANNDTFNASETTAVHWSVGDKVDGGAGTDTLNVVQTAAIAAAAPVGATVANIENINYTSGAAITADTSAFSGVTSVTATNSGANNVVLTGASTTNLSVTNATLGTGTVTVSGGKNVSVNTGELLATGTTGGAITVGSTTAAPTGTVTVTQAQTSAAVADTNATTGGAITVTGGTSVNVTQTIAATAAAAAALVTANASVTHTGGAITVNGTSATKDVTVTQTAAVTAVKSATIGREGIVAGAVDVLDANRASATAAGTIETVTITNAGAATVNSGALKTLNLGGTLTTVNAGTLGALTTAANSTLALNLTGARSTGAVTIDTDIKTLNVAGTTTASTVASLVANGATTVNVSGDAKVTFTDNTLGAVTAINVTNTAGAGFGTTAIGTAVTFTGGAGDDSVVLSNAFTKANTMGAGNDTVTYGGAASTTAGAVGSMAAGDGTDTIIMTDAQAAAADGSSAFNTAFTGFEVLRISNAFVEDALDLDGINGVTKVILAAGVDGTAAINNLASGGTVQINADGANTPALTVGVKSALVGSSDVLNLALSKTGGVLAAGSVTAANVETINITANDAATSPALGSDAVIHTLTLAATSAKTITVSGNNGLNLTNTGNVAVTSFDASGVVANNTAASTYVAATTDTAANLAVTFASANTTTTASVTITGGAGNDTLTGNASMDTITGGAGSDAVNGGTGTDTINVGTGRDVVTIINNDDDTAGDIIGSGTSGSDSIVGYTLSSAISAVDLSSTANFVASTAGGTNYSLLNIQTLADDAGAGAGTAINMAVEANATAQAGQAAGVTYTVTNGILTLGGSGAAAVDTLGEWITEAAAVAATNGDTLAFQFGSDTYVYSQAGTADVLVKLVGVTGAAALVEASAATTAVANSIVYFDVA
jgi:S-layer protein